MSPGTDPANVGVDEAFGWPGWMLVSIIVVTFLLIPVIITVAPPTVISFRFAYLILPVVPAIGLAFVAVWVTVFSDR